MHDQYPPFPLDYSLKRSEGRVWVGFGCGEFSVFGHNCHLGYSVYFPNAAVPFKVLR
jgi:hypothetical protein